MAQSDEPAASILGLFVSTPQLADNICSASLVQIHQGERVFCLFVFVFF